MLVVALIVLGPDRLPKAARQVGQALRELKRLSSSVQEQVHDALDLHEDERDAERAEGRKGAVNPDTSGFTLVDQRTVPNPSVDGAPAEPPRSADQEGHGPRSAAAQHDDDRTADPLDGTEAIQDGRKDGDDHH